ncbi:MAG: phosphoribosyltransferase [Acidobacteria bacterium]|nr:phosphoribosyltransferase [Acidobacteriota bacterium]
MTFARFQDRTEAGRLLAGKLKAYANRPDVVVLALPRGGVPVGYEVAMALHAPLDVFVVRKLGVPGQEELAMGAIASGGVRVLNRPIVEALEITESQIESVAAAEQQVLERRESLYRGGRAAPVIRGKTVILVDDGIATGSTMRAAIAALRKQQSAHLIVAVPVAPLSTVRELQAEGDEVVCARAIEPFGAIGAWYEDFRQVPDEQVSELLETAAGKRSATHA